MTPKKLNHIQVLRAISVLLVFFYHLENGIFQNGYLGVDIFFVISGMVITLKLYETYVKTNKINIKKFFVKRIKRIYPVLIFFLLTTLLMVVIFSPLHILVFKIKVFIFAIFGLSNILYLVSEKDYFSSVFEDPLHHTWSLGVEEQFYFIYPFILSLCFFLFKKKFLKIILTFVSLIIIGAYTTYHYSDNESLIFYLPFFRFWQFLFGCLIFFLITKYKKNNSLISFISFFMIFIIILSQNNYNEFYKLFFVTFFSGIFILFYNEKNILKFFFNSKYLINLGNISYSFYLWHLPIIYFYDLYYVNSLIRIPLIFIITLLISSLSYKYVEQKFRYYNFSKIFLRKYLYILISFILIFLFTFYSLNNKKNYENNLKNSIKDLIIKFNYLEIASNFSDRAIFYKHNINGNQIYRFCKEDSKDYSLNFLKLKNECIKNNTTKKIFFLEGNSHTANFVTMFENSKFIENFYYSHVENINSNNLMKNKEINALSEKFNEFFYVSGIITPYELDLLKEKLKGFNENINVLIIGPIPTFPENEIKVIECFIKKIDCSFDASINIKIFETLNNEIEKLAKSNKVFFYNPYKGLCPNKICYTYNKSKDYLTHGDETHLTIEGSKLLIPHFYDYYKKNLN